ncbi:MAG: DUF2934 domain-containing protein [Verrucomicrobiota bacterium]
MGKSLSERAYQIYLNEGCPEGRHLEHWLQAEKELSGNGTARKNKKTSASSATKPRKTRSKAKA